jgi:hypothetical protein
MSTRNRQIVEEIRVSDNYDENVCVLEIMTLERPGYGAGPLRDINQQPSSDKRPARQNGKGKRLTDWLQDHSYVTELGKTDCGATGARK